MHLTIPALPDLRAHLARLRPDETAATALATEAEHLAQSIRDTLSEPQGSADHAQPWLRTGALRDSIQSTTTGLEATIGTTDPSAAPQEMGTVHLPPRPFLAPAAAAAGTSLANSIAQKVADLLRGHPPPPFP